MRLAGAGDDLSLSHAKIGRSGIASRSNAAHTKADNACCEGKPDKTPNMGAWQNPDRPSLYSSNSEGDNHARTRGVTGCEVCSAGLCGRCSPTSRPLLPPAVFDRWQDVTAKNLSKIARRQENDEDDLA